MGQNTPSTYQPPPITADSAASELRDRLRSIGLHEKAVQRKRWKASEKAMTLADYEEERRAIRYALALIELEGRTAALLAKLAAAGSGPLDAETADAVLAMFRDRAALAGAGGAP